MKLSKNIEILDLGLKIGNYLVIADTHIGHEEALNKQGILIPRLNFEELLERLLGIVAKHRFNRIIINGDIKHEFGKISEQEWRHTLQLIDFLSKHCEELILIRGNHDTILGPIADKRDVKIVDSFIAGDTLIIHGHKLPDNIDKKVRKIIIGHEHPAVSIKDPVRAELFKCFLKGKWKGRELIVMPSFNLMTEGTDILKEEVLSPFLKQNLLKFEVFVAADKVYYFGKLRDI